MSQLPDKLSALLRVAVADARKIEATPGYVLAMQTWHEPITADDFEGTDDMVGKCAVCMAGAVMAQTFGAAPTDDVVPGDYAADRFKLLAIDDMRTGQFGYALRTLGHESGRTPQLINDFVAAHLDVEHGRAPWAIYEQAADMLEAEGL